MVRQAIALLIRRENIRLDDAELLLAVAAVIGVAALALTSIGVPAIRPINYFYNLEPYLVCVVFIGGLRIFYLLVRDRPESPVAYLLDRFGHVVSGLLILIAATVFMTTFSTVKSAIPLFNSFDWDQTFIDADRLLHGKDAWRVLQPVLGYPAVTQFLSICYNLWFFLIYLGTSYFALCEGDPELRRRYLASCFATWSIIGMFLAVCLASVGPCFAQPILGMDTFKEQMAYLYAADKEYPLLSLRVQEFLLEGYRRQTFGFAKGITAMPSMHVALAFLFFLAMRQKARWLGYLFGAFFVMILLGSVHLGFHYAVDGYVSVAVVAVIWKVAGVWARRHTPMTASACR